MRPSLRNLHPHAHALRDPWQDASALFDPRALSALQAWYRADKGVTTSGPNVTAWADSSGVGDSGRNLAVTTGTAPTFNAADANYGGQSTVQFGGSGSITNIYLDSGTWNASYSQPWTIFAVAYTQDGSTRNYMVDNFAGSIGIDAFGGSGVEFFNLQSLHPITAPSVILIGAGGASSTIAVNQATAQTTGADGASPNTTSLLRLGSFASAGVHSLGGPIAELAFFSRALTATERGNLIYYTNARYGLSAAGGIKP